MSAAPIDNNALKSAFGRFQKLLVAKSGHPFSNFDDGMIAVWEGYKPRLRDQAREILNLDQWSESEIGNGAILDRTIAAIEIQDERRNLTNNLVFWQNRFGHANREHRALLEARPSAKDRRELERALFTLYRGNGDGGLAFERLSQLTGAKYPLLAYLHFLKDMDRFMPIQPTGFDRAFEALSIPFSTLRQCNWENYTTFNATLGKIADRLVPITGLKSVRLVDAHSFCWVFASLLRQEAEGALTAQTGKPGVGRIVGGREKSIIAMRVSAEQTTKNSNGQIILTTVKNKDLRIDPAEFDAYLTELMTLQEDRCALTGIAFHFHGPEADKNLLPSLDRIDSCGHYERGNLQVVCRFINFWKGSADNAEFARLLALVRGQEQ